MKSVYFTKNILSKIFYFFMFLYVCFVENNLVNRKLLTDQHKINFFFLEIDFFFKV